MLSLLASADRWRPHIRTAKLAFTIRRLIENGIVNLKCATTLELFTACEAGAKDVLVAFALTDNGALRVREIAERFPALQISSLIENAAQVERWRGSRVGLFLDIDSGMNRTGANPERLDDNVALVQAAMTAGLAFGGVHYYEGHRTEPNLAERKAQAHAGYAKLLRVITTLVAAQLQAEEVITSGTPALPCALAFEGFRDRRFPHRVSSGTVVYNDATSMVQLPPEYGLKPAALVIATVVSRPRPGLITCDAGHKTISADAGIPTCMVHDHAGFRPSSPSEEHLPISIAEGVTAPEIGDLLYLVPRHVCPDGKQFRSCVDHLRRQSVRHRTRLGARPRDAAANRRHQPKKFDPRA